ncbi:MAG: thiosulfate sulfurtransferase GlpE [Methylococcaceae bacterium]|nr:thiosulfate sulfurtransferase GlpE [Methylococcaceae bacterium]
MSTPHRWRRMTVNQTRKLLKREGLAIFDMRDQASFSQEHIEGALFLSNANLEEVILKTPKDKPVLIYCYHGNASQTGAQIFTDFGFKEVYDLVGGYEAWRTALLSAVEPEPCPG